jgi:hypothetical protein
MFLVLSIRILSQRYGSGSYYHQAKIVRKTLIPTILWLLYDDFENLCKYTFKCKQQNLVKNRFFLASWRSVMKIAGSRAGSGSISQMHGSKKVWYMGRLFRETLSFMQKLWRSYTIWRYPFFSCKYSTSCDGKVWSGSSSGSHWLRPMLIHNTG